MQRSFAEWLRLGPEMIQGALLLSIELGGAAFALAHYGGLDDNRLARHVQRIHELYAQLDALAQSAS